MRVLFWVFDDVGVEFEVFVYVAWEFFIRVLG